MKKLWNFLHKVSEKLHLPDLPNWLLILLGLLLVLRIPSFFEPYFYGDEMIYLSLGEAVRQGKTLYLTVHDNKPPLLYLIAALSGSLVVFRAILAFWMLATTVIFWRLSQALFPKKGSLQLVSTIIFGILTTIPFLEGNIANAELFMIGPTMLAFYLLFAGELTAKKLFTSGLLFSFATLFKVPAFFDVPVIFVFWLIVGGLTLKNIKKLTTSAFYLGLGYLIPILLTFVWYYFKGALNEYLIAAYLQNVGYLSSFRPGDIQEPFLVRNLPLLIRGGVVVLGVGIISLFRKKLSRQFLFLTIWLLFTLFAVTLSERPYPHYLIQSVPSLALFAGILFTQKSIEQSLTVIPLALAFFVPYYFNFWLYPTGSYYLRFINFATGRISKETYISSFDQNTLRNYELADFITNTTRKTDPIFIWGDSSAIYALSRRLPPIKYVADYHINDFSTTEEVLTGLNTTKPKLIVLLPNSPSFGALYDFLGMYYIQVDDVEGAEIWTLISTEESF